MSDLDWEISRRARHLLRIYGEPSERANSPDYRRFRRGRIFMELNHDRECLHEYLTVWLSIPGSDSTIVYREADGVTQSSFFALESEQQVTIDLMRELMILEDLADV